MLTAATLSAFVIVPAESEGYGPETEVAVYLYDEFPQQTP